MSEAAKKIEQPCPAVRRVDLPYATDDGLGARARIGVIVLASDYTIEQEFRQIITPLDGVSFYGTRIANANEINRETLAAMEAGIRPCTEVILPGGRLDVVAYGCTSGAMVIGDDNVKARIHEARPGVPYTTPMRATYVALRALGARKVCYIAPYIEEVCDMMCQDMAAHGFEATTIASWKQPDDRVVSSIDQASVEAAVRTVGRDESDAIFISCSSVRVAGFAEALEREVGKPVISSNLAMAWHCLRLTGVDDVIEGYGALFRRPVVD